EDATPVHPPELRVERERGPRMIGWLEVVASADEWIEVPPGQREARQEANGHVRGEIAGPLRRTEGIDGEEPRRAADRRERVARRSTDLEGDPAAVPSHCPRHVQRALGSVGRVEGRLEIARPGCVPVNRE